uniref:Uncharacterized protein n=1 Tax=Cacopsylla melanoneura TaxID=428564 RepID=A0A8D8WT41_9HEMI
MLSGKFWKKTTGQNDQTRGHFTHFNQFPCTYKSKAHIFERPFKGWSSLEALFSNAKVWEKQSLKSRRTLEGRSIKWIYKGQIIYCGSKLFILIPYFWGVK